MNGRQGTFCRAYLRSMNPEQAAAESGRTDGYTALEDPKVQALLERMRSSAAAQLRREDALRRLAELAFGRANDAVRLALRPEEAVLETLDLSAVAELKVTEKGVELKLVDRVRALETLCTLLEDGGRDGAEELCQALREAAGTWEAGDGK